MIREFLRFRPLPVGSEAPNLSLTADEGTWIRLLDFKDHLNVLLYFFNSTDHPDAEAYLRELHQRRGDFEELETAIFGVCPEKSETLRGFRERLGLDFYLVYDVFAMTGRTFGACRIRPRLKDTVVLVDKQGNLAVSERGRPPIQRLLEIAARLQGVEIEGNGGGAVMYDDPVDEARARGRAVGDMPEMVKDVDSTLAESMVTEDESLYILVDVRTKGEFDSNHSPHSIHIPVDEIPHRYQELGQNDYIIFVCQMGGRSAAAAEFMTSIGGHEIYNVKGGMTAWEGEQINVND